MTTLPAWSSEFKELYPYGATVHDATGRHLTGVMACNPLTGEVVMVDFRPSPWDRMVAPLRRSAQGWLRDLVFRSDIPRRHGFWPAPLVVTPMSPSSNLASVRYQIERAQQRPATSGLTLAQLDDLIDAMEPQP